MAYFWDKEASWQTEKAVVWTIGMISLYLIIGQYQGRVDDDMREFMRKYVNPPGDHSVPKKTDPIWYWVALVLAYKNGKPLPGDILPQELQKGQAYEQFGNWLSKLLCKEEERVSVLGAFHGLYTEEPQE